MVGIMYYLYNDTGTLIDEYENVESGLNARSMFPDSILLYYSGNRTDVWEHGIEVMAPDPPRKFFSYEIMYENGSVLMEESDTLEGAIDRIKWELDHNEGAKLWGEIEEISSITHKVKL